MKEQRMTFGQGVALGVGVAIGVKVVDKAIDLASKLNWGLVGDAFVFAHQRAYDHNAFDAWVMSGMRPNWESDSSRAFWDSLNLTNEEKARLKGTIWNEVTAFLPVRPVGPTYELKVCNKCGAHYLNSCSRCYPVKTTPRNRRKKALGRRRSMLALGPAPVVQAPKAEPPKKRRGRDADKMNNNTAKYMKAFDECMANGSAKDAAIDKVTARYCPTDRGAKNFRRAMVKFVRKYRGR